MRYIPHLRFMISALCVSAAATTTQAADLNSLQALGQSEFRAVAEDLSAALSYQSLAPAKTLGITGFDISIAATGTVLENQAALQKASSGDSVPSTLVVPTLRVAKGLPLNIDIGAFYLAVPSSNIKLYGAEVRWAFVEGGFIMPAIAVHGVYSKLNGVDQLNLDNRSVDVSISKGFTLLTPYAGVGYVWTNATPVNIPLLTKETIKQTKVFAGLNINFGLPNLAIEADQTGGITRYGAKFGLRW